jgi:chromosome segregation ATPase
MLERLKQAETASEQVLQGIQSMSDTMSQVLEKQRLLEDRVSAGAEKAGAEAPADSDRLVAEISNMKKEQAVWQKDVERVIKLTTDAFGENSPFVPTQNFEQKTAELMRKISDLQKDLNEGAGFTPRSEHHSVPIEESVRRISVFDAEGRASAPQVSVPQISAMPEYEDKMKSLSAKVSELQTEVDTKIQDLKDAQGKLKSDADTIKGNLETALKKLEEGKSGLDNEVVKDQKELDSRVSLIEGRLKEVEAGLLSGVGSPMSQTKSAERSDLEMEIMQQYQTAIGHANNRIKDNQAAIDELKSAQLKWNGKLEQTLEVANEAFGQNTPFVMKEQVEHLEADHQNLLTELQTLRDSVAQLESSVTAAADNAAEAREKDTARSSMQDQIASLTKAIEQQQESLKTKIAQLESSVTAAAATSDNAAAGAARSAETPGGDNIDKGSAEAARVELEALSTAMEKEKKAREALETKVDQLVDTARAQGEAEAREKDAARSSMQDQIASLTKAIEQQQESLKTKIAQLESSVTAAAATSDNAAAGAARSAETPGGDNIDKGSAEAARVELEALSTAMEKEKKAREALETKVDQLVDTARAQGEAEAREKDAARSSMQDQIASLTKAIEQQQESLKTKINEGIQELNATMEKEKQEREALRERFTALEPMRDEFVAEKMHTDSELNILKQQVQELTASQQTELESTKKWLEKFESKSGNGAAESKQVVEHSDLKDLKDTLMQTINSREEVLEKQIKEGLEAHRGDAAAESASKSEMAKRFDSLLADVKSLKDGVASQQTAQRSIEDAVQAAIARSKTLQESTQKQENDVKKHEEEINAMKKAMKKSDEEYTEDAKARR